MSVEAGRGRVRKTISLARPGIALQEIILQRGSYILRLPDGGRVFVKASSSTQRGPIDGLKEIYEREKVCLKVLRGLAVPKLTSLPKRLLPTCCLTPGMTYIAQSWEGEKIDYAGLDPMHGLAAWLFIIEQLAAFRRQRILYTDVKCANVLVQTNPFRVIIIDFGAATYVARSSFRLTECGFTRGFVPPECRAGHGPTERSLVFPVGILLPHVLSGMTSFSINSSSAGLDHVERILRRIDAADVMEVVRACLADDPANRPRNYEKLLTRVRSCQLPEKVKTLWHDLRQPYRQRLAALGLKE
jgi:serine/threonine protein kinase